MKINSKKILHALAAMLALVTMSACEPEANIKEYVYPEPSVASFYPTEGYTGTQVIISGTNFGNYADAVKLHIGATEVTRIISCKNDRVIFEVPTEATTGPISLQVWTHELADIGTFNVIPTPEITQIVSSNTAGDIFGAAGDKITISGKAFGTNPEDVTVTINNKELILNSVEDTQIEAILPDDFTSGIIMVRVRDLTLEGTAIIDPTVKGDVTNLFLKNYCQPFERAEAGETEWAIAKSWQGNASANIAHTLQFTDEEPNGLFVLDGNNKFDGAQVYQETTLPPGSYDFEVDVLECNKTSGRFGACFGVGKSEKDFATLTDANKTEWHFPESADIYTQATVNVGAANCPATVTCSCDFTQTTGVRIGFGAMIANGQSFKIKAIRIIRK